MNCQQAQNLFDAYLDGELSASLATELGAHRVKCARCRHQLALMEVAGHIIAVDSDPNMKLDAEFTDRLLACIERPQSVSKRRWTRPLWIVGSTLAAAACLVIVFKVWFSTPEGRVLGVKEFADAALVDDEADVTDTEIDRAFDSAFEQLESTWTTRAKDTYSLIEFGEMTIMQILDRFGIDEAIEPAEPHDVMPESFDELAPGADADEDIEDL